MMKISTKGRYALRIMLDLATNATGAPVSLHDVAEHQQITLKYMESIMAILLQARFVTSTRGKTGGYRLSREPQEYSAYEILSVVEGDLAPVKCLAGTANICPRRHTCPTLPLWEELDDIIKNYLLQHTLADLLQNRRSNQ